MTVSVATDQGTERLPAVVDLSGEQVHQNGTDVSATAAASTATDPPAWHSFTPWFMMALSVVVLFAIAWFLLDNIGWFKALAFDANAPTTSAYRIYVYQLHLSMIKRSVGLFSGFALIFVGTSVAFYTLAKDTDFGGTAAGGSVKLTTASPGIIAMILGVALIMFTIYSKDQFPLAPDDAPVDVKAPAINPQ